MSPGSRVSTDKVMMNDTQEHLVLVHNSHWASNIGNAFFTLGVVELLRTACSESRVVQTDQLSSIAWHRPRWLIRRNDVEYPSYSEPDWFVLAGPMFKEKFVDLYERVLERVFADNDRTRLVILNAGSIAYSEREVSRCREFLKQFPPYILVSRDRFTYDRYSDLAEHAHDGIDTAFFASKYYEAYPTPKLQDYVTVTLDKSPEPRIRLGEYEPAEPDTWKSVDVASAGWKNRIPIGRALSHFTAPKTIDRFHVVRPTHKTKGEPAWKIFLSPNSFASMTPFGYLNLYANTSLTISDRVHACVATLAYGNPARLVYRTKRSALFDRAGLASIGDEIRTLDRSFIEDEWSEYRKFLEAAYQASFDGSP